MSDSNSEYTPRTYVKGGRTRVANSPARAVALEFDGFKLQAQAPTAPVVEAPVEVVQSPVNVPAAVVKPRPTPPKKDQDKS